MAKKKKKKKYNLQGTIINLLRNLSLKHPQRKEVEDRTKVAPATHECEKCGVWIYKGKSQKNFDALKTDNPDKNIIMCTPQIDHISPIIPILKGWKFTYDEFIERTFCGSENLQLLCKSCHHKKTQEENELRRNL
jgi:hypothetical protein